jgi:hypothetical protein
MIPEKLDINRDYTIDFDGKLLGEERLCEDGSYGFRQ